MKRWYSPRELMQISVELAAQSVAEDDNRVHPKVGAVIARDGIILQTGFRGDLGHGKHAEQSALMKFKRPSDAKDSTVYTTLEPCTERGSESCTSLLLKHGVLQVVYGMLDPNPDIRGMGEWRLEQAGVQVGKFESDLVKIIRDQNADFIEYMQGIGVHITSPSERDFIGSPISVSGTYRIRPRTGDRVRLFVNRGNEFFPQGEIRWDVITRTWQCNPVYTGGGKEPVDYSIIVARVSDDLDIALRHYSKVGFTHGHWVGLELSSSPPGFEELASVKVVWKPEPSTDVKT